MEAHRIRQRLDDAEAVDALRHLQRQASAAVLINQRQDAQAPTITGLALDEVEAPNVIAMLRPQPHARAVVQPQRTAWLMLPCPAPSVLADPLNQPGPKPAGQVTGISDLRGPSDLLKYGSPQHRRSPAVTPDQTVMRTGVSAGLALTLALFFGFCLQVPLDLGHDRARIVASLLCE